MDTGFSIEEVDSIKDNKGKCGLELDIDSSAHIIKNPHLSLHINYLYQKYSDIIEHVIIPMRYLDDVCYSRERVGINERGGFWGGAKDLDTQGVVSCHQIYVLMYDLCKYNTPFTTIHFPSLALHSDYLWDKLKWLFDYYNVNKKDFKKIHKQTVNLDYINFHTA